MIELRCKLSVKIVAGSMVTGLMMGLPSSALAQSSGELPEGVYAIVDGEYFPIDHLVEEAQLDLDKPIAGTPTSRLIDFTQWVGCFSGNQSSLIFATYKHGWSGVTKDINLRCGDSTFGYKHIRAEHEKNWQAKLDAITPLGFMPDASWDDVMSVGAYTTIQYPEYVLDKPGNKRCALAGIAFINNKGVIIQTFNVIAVWATDKSNLISAYPTTRQVC